MNEKSFFPSSIPWHGSEHWSKILPTEPRITPLRFTTNQIPNTRAFLTAAVFDLTREHYVQTDPGTFLPVQRGKARSRGLELEAVATFESGWDLIAAYTLLNNEVRETVDPSEQGKRLVQVPAQFGSVWWI